MYRTALHTNLCKDLKIQHMDNKFNALGLSVNQFDFIPGDFSRYTSIFSEKELAMMRILDSRQANDSAFLRAALKSLYNNELARLINITVTGRSGTMEISPAKKIILKEAFEERLDGIELDDQEKERRNKRFNNVLAKAINTILSSDLKVPRAKKQLVFE